jgi:hypothetical protein
LRSCFASAVACDCGCQCEVVSTAEALVLSRAAVDVAVDAEMDAHSPGADVRSGSSGAPKPPACSCAAETDGAATLHKHKTAPAERGSTASSPIVNPHCCGIACTVPYAHQHSRVSLGGTLPLSRQAVVHAVRRTPDVCSSSTRFAARGPSLTHAIATRRPLTASTGASRFREAEPLAAPPPCAIAALSCEPEPCGNDGAAAEPITSSEKWASRESGTPAGCARAAQTSVPCRLLWTTCRPCAERGRQRSALRYVQDETYNMQRTACNLQCSACNIKWTAHRSRLSCSKAPLQWAQQL